MLVPLHIGAYRKHTYVSTVDSHFFCVPFSGTVSIFITLKIIPFYKANNIDKIIKRQK